MNVFTFMSGLVLGVVSIAKLVSSFGSAKVLLNRDPLIGIEYQKLFILAGAAEMSVALICFFASSSTLKATLVAWLATCLAIYRLGLTWIGYTQPCNCLGSLTGALHISTRIADTAMKIVLSYLLLGSYIILIWLWTVKRQYEVDSPNIQ
jgi:hypothetical protein